MSTTSSSIGVLVLKGNWFLILDNIDLADLYDFIEKESIALGGFLIKHTYIICGFIY